MDDQFEQVKDIFVKRLGLEREDIRLDSHLIDDLDADSLFIIELALDIERIFHIKIPDDQLDQLQTIKDVLNQIKN